MFDIRQGLRSSAIYRKAFIGQYYGTGAEQSLYYVSIVLAPAASPSWEQQHLSTLDNKDLKKGLKLLWFATGNEDFLIQTSKSTVEMLKKHGFSPVYKETFGGHTWANWREYLNKFAPQLFQ